MKPLVKQLSCSLVLLCSVVLACSAGPKAAPPSQALPKPARSAPLPSDPEQSALDRWRTIAASAPGSVSPDVRAEALFRLAAFSSQRERAQPGADLPTRLQGPISLQRRVAREFPSYPKMRNVYYQLGHDLLEAQRHDEAGQLWRSLVCHNHYPYPVPPDPKNPERDTVTPLPQDHDQAYWVQWLAKHPGPSSVRNPSNAPDAEKRYRNPYPDSCTPLAGHESSEGLLTEVWFRIAEDHFDSLDNTAGVYSLNRAATAYRKVLARKPPDTRFQTLASYKLAWTLYRQQRYEAAVRQFVEVLHLPIGEDVHKDAVQYLAICLLGADLAGPAEDEPFLVRLEILEQEKSPAVAERKMSVGIARVQTASLVPQDQAWTPEVYLALAVEYRNLNQLHNVLETYALFLRRWPLHRRALATRFERAQIVAELARSEPARYTKKSVSDAFKEVERQAAPGAAWRAAHASEPEAVKEAEEVRRAAELSLRALP